MVAKNSTNKLQAKLHKRLIRENPLLNITPQRLMENTAIRKHAEVRQCMINSIEIMCELLI